MTTKKPRIWRGPASAHTMQGEEIFEFSDGRSGGLISMRRHPDGHLLVQLYNTDEDVQVTSPPKPLVTPDATYEPWTDGWAVGFKVTRGAVVEYIYLNPSGDSDDGVPTVFLYQGTAGDPSEDEAYHHYDFGQPA